MTDLEQAFAEQQAQLRVKFAQRTFDEADVLEDLSAGLAGAHDEESRSKIHHLVHRLAGGAGVFGFGELTELAAAVELLIATNCSNEQLAMETKKLALEMREITGPILQAIKA